MKAKPALKAAVVSLVNPEELPIDQDYVNALRALLRRAERGESTGLAFVEMTGANGKNGYKTITLGLLDQNPTFCIGAIEVLKAKVMKRVPL